MTNVITVYQPYASLIMAGVKTWETRGCPPHGDMRPEGVRGLPGKQINAGDRIGIAATMWRPKTVTAWDQGGIPALVAPAALGYEVLPGWDQTSECELGGGTFEWSGPLGALLGTVEVVDVVPIREWITCTLDASERHICRDSGLLHLIDHERGDSDIDDQVPFGHWEPGGWAWELVNPIRTTAQCPACDGSGWILDCDACRESGKSLADTDCSASGCRVCKRTGSCPPIPAKGKQGVWEWKEGTRG